ncbi:MAG: IreB family regulatory phosphoprotein [Lachnospiraceae bacterium]|nr:IreB family regulatory phosphoprotein [Lachnospiraceae bacterium]
MDRDVTQIIYTANAETSTELDVKEILAKVYAALRDKGYNPINQLVQYIMSGEPLFITSHNGARSLITKAERDEIVEELVKSYIEHNFKELS